MKIIMTLLVRNEEDIIRENLEYHLKSGVDFFIITDHHSDDTTYDILLEYEKMGVAQIRREMSLEHHQAQWVTEMARAATQMGADWVINNDADEFWISDSGNLKSFFETVDPAVCKIHANRYDFFYRPFKNAKFYEAMLFRETRRRWTKCCHRSAEDIIVEVGNHDANAESFAKKDLRTTSYDNLKIFHYPVRTIERYKKKMIEGTTAVLSTPGIPPETFFHWKKALQCINEDKFEEYIALYTRSGDLINSEIFNGNLRFDDTLQKFFL